MKRMKKKPVNGIPETVAELKASDRNPRRITEWQMQALKKSLKKFGDLGGIVFNTTTKHLVGGHQRIAAFKEGQDAKLEVTETFVVPDECGTVAVGWVSVDGTRHMFRAVQWDEQTEAAANIAANQHGGEFEDVALRDILNGLKSIDFDMDLAGFDANALTCLLADPPEPTPPEDFKSVDENVSTEFQCPRCKYAWSGKPS